MHLLRIFIRMITVQIKIKECDWTVFEGKTCDECDRELREQM